MDELIESLFTEELGTIRYQQHGPLGQPELPATPVAPEATSPPPEIPSSLSSSAGGNSRKRSSPSSDDNLCGSDILQVATARPRPQPCTPVAPAPHSPHPARSCTPPPRTCTHPFFASFDAQFEVDDALLLDV